MKLAAIACLVAWTLPLCADTVITTDGRTLTGEVVEEGDKIVVKMKIGQVKLDKSQVKEIQRDGGSVPAAGGSAQSYKSYLLGYVLRVPTTKYVLQRVPPEPLVDVILYDSGSESEIALAVCSAEEVPDPLDGGAAQSLGNAVKGGLDLYFQNLDVVSAKAVKLGPFETARVVLEGQRRDTKRKQHLVRIFFRLRGQPMCLRGEALVGKHKALEADCDKIVETLEPFEPAELDGKTYVDMKGCYSITEADDWAITRHESQAERGHLSMSQASTKAVVTSEWRLDRSKKGVRDLGKEEESASKAKGLEVLASRVANVKGKVAWQLDYRQKTSDGTVLLTRVCLFRTVDRIYTLGVSVPDGTGKPEEAGAAVFDSFQIFPDLLSKGSLENGRQAVALVRDADEKRIGGSPGASIPLYDRAIELYPPFAGAFNNRGLAYREEERFDEAYRDMQTASELAPNDFLVTRNMAICRIEKAYKSLDEGRITSAIDEADRLRGRAKDDEQLSEILGIFYFNVGIHYYNQRKLGTAKAFFKKGMDFYHDKEAVKRNLSIIAYNEAIEALNKDNWRSAKSFLEESLKYDSSNGQAKQLLQQVNEELSK